MEGLVYLDKQHGTLDDLNGSVRRCLITRDLYDTLEMETEVQIFTTYGGLPVTKPFAVTVDFDAVLNRKPMIAHDIEVLYQYTQKDGLTASCYVDKSRKLNEVTRANLGSGIYGIIDPDINSDHLHPIPFKVSNYLSLQDVAHSESLTIASHFTNSKLQSVLDGYDVDVTNLYELWNIVLERVERSISQEALTNILEDYIEDYQVKELIELPINYILQRLGYQGIVGVDEYDNSWTRQCVSFDTSNAKYQEKSRAAY